MSETTTTNLEARLAALSPEQRALFLRLQKDLKPAPPKHAPQPPPIPRVSPPDGTGDWPLSFDQERLWFIHMLEPGNTAYNIDLGTRMRGRLDLPAMRAAIDEVVRRHAAWRSSFPLVDGRPVQRIAPPRQVFVPTIDLSALPVAAREATGRQIQFREGRLPFPIESGPLVRFHLVKMAAEDHLCMLTVHHNATDWITFQLFRKELGLIYAAYRDRRRSPLPEVPVQYPDFAVWQRDWLRGEVLDVYLDHWRRALDGVPLFLDLPADRPWPPTQSLRGGEHKIHVPAVEVTAWRALARRANATTFMVLLSAVAATFSRLSGQDKLVLGTPSANRNRPEIEPIFGFFITQLAIPIDLSGDPSLAELVVRARRSAITAFEYQDVPFTKLVETLNPERGTGRAPVIQSAVLLLDEQYTVDDVPGLTFEPVQVFDGNSRYDLMWGLYEGKDVVHGTYEFNADVFDPATALRIHRHVVALLAAGAAEPDRPFSELSFLAPAERHELLAEGSAPALATPAPHVEVAIERQAQATPDRVAVVGGAEGEIHLSYGELDRRAALLAEQLRRERSAGAERIVGVLAPRGPVALVALLGVWKAGAAYLPLDPSYPAERLAHALSDAGAIALLSPPELFARAFPTGAPDSVASLPIVRLDRAPTALGGHYHPHLAPLGADDSLAYVIYTSGTTGRPKGVGVPRAAIATLLASVAVRPGFAREDALLAVSSFGFDIAGVELFLPLSVGGRVEIADGDDVRDGARLLARLERSGAAVLQATPGVFRLLIDAGWNGRPALAAWSTGEPLPPGLATELAVRAREVWNLYGPTETTVFSTVAQIAAGDRVDRDAGSGAARRLPITEVSIGQPVAATRLAIVDRTGELAALGAIGELLIGGAGVARGYLGRPDLTAERFVPDAFAAEPGARAYRTGDLVRRRADGALHCLGRRDHQVKVRGFRIELGEIEAALSRHPQIAEAAVVARGTADGGAGVRLAAYVVGAGLPAPAALREFLLAELPEPFVPSFIVELPALPRTSNGKVDRRALPAPEGAAVRAPFVAPATATERQVAATFAEVLGLDVAAAPVGAHDSFFELGGHSLLAAQVAHRLARALGVTVPVRRFFEHPTVARLAAALDRERSSAPKSASSSAVRPPLRPAPLGTVAPLSFAQERLWFLDRLAGGSATYNIPMAFVFSGPLDVRALAAALSAVVARHEALRTTFELVDGAPVQRVAPPTPFRLPRIDLSPLASARAEREARRLAVVEAREPFDLERGPLLRAALVGLTPLRTMLALDVHHTVFDAWSVGVLLGEASAFYRGASAGRSTDALARELPALPVQYGDFALWQRSWLQGGELERQVGWYRRRLAGAPDALELPTDRPRPALQSFAGASLRVAFPAELSRRAFEVARREGATEFMLLFALYAALLARLSGERDVVLGTTIANRDAAELEGLIGYFINTLPLRLELGGDPTFRDLVARVRAEALEAYAHRDVPFEKLVEELKPARDRSRPPIVQSVLTWQNAAVPAIELGAVHLEPLAAESETSKFDLTLVAGSEAGRIQGTLEYATALFDRATIERFVERFQAFTAAVVERPESRLSDLPLLSTAERDELVVARNRTATPFPREASVPQLFAEQAAERPDSIALSSTESGLPVALSYGELARRSMKLARQLAGLGVGLEQCVGVLAERRPESIVAILGVLEAGAAYVPLDPGFPAERQALLLADCGAQILLGRRAALDELPSSVAGAVAIRLAVDEEDPAFAALAGRPERPLADNLAYVMYTSGSTGRPKGVWVTHRNVVRLVRDTDFARFSPGEVFFLFAPLAFDATTFEIWGALLNGGRLAVAPEGPLSPGELKRELAREAVTSLWLTAGLFHQMVDYGFSGLPALAQLLAGGDVLGAAQVRAALEQMPHGRLIDGYGPTEGTTFTCCFGVDDPARVPDSMPIGGPIANARVYVLDPDLAPVARGAWGELFAGGDGIARGYLGRPDLTAERFVPDPFGAEHGSGGGSGGGRLYRTGDLVRWPIGDGPAALDFLGRRDGQVKVRGFRIELAEVEAALLADARVREAAAIVREDRPGDKRLVAYVALRGDDAPTLDKFRHLGVSGAVGPGEEEVARDLTARLAARLPEPFVPQAIVVLPALPLTPNGKVDRRALPAPGERRGDDYVAPETDLEIELASVAAEVLGRERVGLRDNFFALGGHSLLATRFVAELESRSGLAVPLQDVFDSRDLGELAERIVERELAQADEGVLAELLAAEGR